MKEQSVGQTDFAFAFQKKTRMWQSALHRSINHPGSLAFMLRNPSQH